VNVGVVIAALLFMKRMAESVQVQQQLFETPGAAGELPDPQIALPPSVLVYRIDGPFFFGAAEKLESTLERVPLGIRTIVLRLGRVPFMDATGMQTLIEVIQRFRRHGVRVMLCGIHPALREPLRQSGVLELVGEESICANLTELAVAVGAEQS